MAPDETEQKANSKAVAIMSHTSAAQRQKRIEKYILQSGKMYGQLKKELKMAIHRIIRDKYHKTVGHEGLNKNDRAKFLSDLYTYLSQQIRVTLESTVNQYRGHLHEDLIEDLVNSMKGEEEKRKKVFKEEYIAKMERLASEYENIRNFRKAEQFYTKLLLKEPNNVNRLTKLAIFSLKCGDIDKGFEFFRRAKSLDQKSQKLTLAFAGILISRKRFNEAKKVLSEILDVDFKHCHANILYSLICEANNRPGLVRKHIAIAKVQRMRELELLPRKVREIPNLNEINFKLERPNWANIATKDQTMDSKENDKLFFEVIEFMLTHYITSVADSLLKYIQNKDSDKYKLEYARTRFQQHTYDEAVEHLDKVLSKNEINASALILRGNSYFDDGNIFDSEESYIKFIQNCSIKDADSKTHYYFILERLGMVYIERKAWKDAKVVFMRCTKEYPTMNGWLNLGIACLRLQSYNEAEDALSQANLLDTHYAKIWGYTILLCLKYSQEARKDQAEFCLARALKLNIEDDYLLEEIGDIYADKNSDFAIACFERCIQITQKRGEIYQKYGTILLSQKRNQRPKGIQMLKEAIKKIDGDQNKSHIALILQEALREDGRDQEAEEYAQYVQGTGTTS